MIEGTGISSLLVGVEVHYSIAYKKSLCVTSHNLVYAHAWLAPHHILYPLAMVPVAQVIEPTRILLKKEIQDRFKVTMTCRMLGRGEESFHGLYPVLDWHRHLASTPTIQINKVLEASLPFGVTLSVLSTSFSTSIWIRG